MKSILFKPFLAKQVRDGNKTQTRRIIKIPSNFKYLGKQSSKMDFEPSEIAPHFIFSDGIENIAVKPKYQIGETIYIKETFEINGTYNENMLIFWIDIKYNDGKTESFTVEQEIFEKYCEKVGKKYSPLFMPEIFARNFLKITKIRAEKVKDISEDDAIAEGIERTRSGYIDCLDTEGFLLIGENAPRSSFASLWDSINGKDESKCWDANPWVFVHEFEKV